MSTAEPAVPVSRLPDADMQAAPAALVRAARRARELAAHRCRFLCAPVQSAELEAAYNTQSGVSA